MCKLGDGNAFCQVSSDKANIKRHLCDFSNVAGGNNDDRFVSTNVGLSPNISLPSCTLPWRLLVLFPLCNLDYLYILLLPCNSVLLIPPPTDWTSVVCSLQSLDGTLFCLFIENFQTTGLTLSWKPGQWLIPSVCFFFSCSSIGKKADQNKAQISYPTNRTVEKVCAVRIKLTLKRALMPTVS